MKSFLGIAMMLVLTGFSFASAASLNFGDDKLPEFVNDLEESVESLLRDAAEQVKDLNSVDDLDLKTKHVSDQSPLLTVQEEEMEAMMISSSDNDHRGFCVWHGLVGICCNKTVFVNTNFVVCVKIFIKPKVGIAVRVIINKHHLGDHFIRNNTKYAFCGRKGHLIVCVVFHNVLVTSNHAQGCFTFLGKYNNNIKLAPLGCAVRKFSVTETAEESLMKLTEGEQNEDILSFQEEDIKTDEFLNFKQ